MTLWNNLLPRSLNIRGRGNKLILLRYNLQGLGYKFIPLRYKLIPQGYILSCEVGIGVPLSDKATLHKKCR